MRAGLHRATGGDGSDACSGDMLLEALAACVGVTLRSVVTAMQIDIRSARVHAESTFDARSPSATTWSARACVRRRGSWSDTSESV